MQISGEAARIVTSSVEQTVRAAVVVKKARAIVSYVCVEMMQCNA